MSQQVINDERRNRYELRADGGVAVAYYEPRGDAVTFTHTVVPEGLRGRGLGSILIAGALADVRRRGIKAVAQCSFVAAYLQRHPEERDLLV